ncbi:hypothetical protein J437_LFUL001645 [Ladona fulva]|uniref:NUC153 domain-containing protein n=1 Tax=Ladona fulva TaxID=123851 RepID=A0A8K0JYR0_LADFU|nr:hypothetical protein J437_LFUL001645 [Ladona fulva]
MQIYPSEFGKQRMKEEDVKGPLELTSEKVEDDDENNPDKDEEREEGSDFHMEKLRKYQLNRLKYFYAVVVCDSVATADKLYAECDGLEYESSAIRLDLRFIPDDMTFDDEPREICNSMPDPSKYQPRYFVTKALQQAKVECTWDETDPNRVELAEKIMKSNGDVDDEDIQAYLASSDEDSCEESDKEDDESVSGDEDRVGKYRSLIKEIQEREKAKSDKDVEMEVTWGIGLKEKTEKLVKEKLKEQKEELTPFEKYLEKRKEKKKLKKKERKASLKGEEEAFSDDDIPSDVDLNDPYFKEELEKGDKNAKKKKGSRKKTKGDSSDNEEQRKARVKTYSNFAFSSRLGMFSFSLLVDHIAAELELLLMDNDSKNHFNLTEIMKQEKDAGKKKRRKGKSQDKEVPPDDNFQIDVKDPRFEAIYTSHHFNIDPADPHFRKTKAMDALVTEKLYRRENESKGNFKSNIVSEESGKRDAELSLLVKSVKRKTENMKAKKRQKIG